MWCFILPFRSILIMFHIYHHGPWITRILVVHVHKSVSAGLCFLWVWVTCQTHVVYRYFVILIFRLTTFLFCKSSESDRSRTCFPITCWWLTTTNLHNSLKEIKLVHYRPITLSFWYEYVGLQFGYCVTSTDTTWRGSYLRWHDSNTIECNITWWQFFLFCHHTHVWSSLCRFYNHFWG